MTAHRENDPLVGLWQQFPTPMASRFLAQMGWDFVVLDMQHGCLNFETAYECIHTLRACGCRPWVRTSIGNYSEINKVLDLGAQGVVVPMINSREEAEMAATSAKYAPLGGRSFGGDPCHHYGESYAETANESTWLLVQIEHIRAVNAVEEILSVPGVDGCFVGPTDLALSLGLRRDNFADNPDVAGAIQRTMDACRRVGKIACCNTYSLSEAREKAVQGYGCITLQSDVDLFINSTSQLLEDLRREVRGGAAVGVSQASTTS